MEKNDINTYIIKDNNMQDIDSNASFKRGGQLLDVLYKACQNAACLELKSIMEDIFYSVNAVLAHQLGGWMMHGQLLDPYNEFFLHKTTSDTEDSLKDNYEQELGAL